MPKRLAMTVDGTLTYCTADDEHIGKGRCNHVAHQKAGENPQTFLDRANQILKDREEKSKQMQAQLDEDSEDEEIDDVQEGFDEVECLEDIIPEPDWNNRYNKAHGTYEGIDSDGETLRFVMLWASSSTDRLKVDGVDLLSEIYDNHENGKDEENEQLFLELGLDYADDIDEDTNTLTNYILTKNMSKFNPYPEFGKPQIELDAYVDPEGGFGYSWPLDQVIDKLKDDQLCKCPAEANWSSTALNKDDPVAKRLYDRVNHREE